MKVSPITRSFLRIALIYGSVLLPPVETCAQSTKTQRDEDFPVNPYAVAQDETDSLSLDECVATALKNNPDLQAAIDELDAAYARYEGARSALMPSLRIEGGYERYSDGQRVLPPHGTGESGVFSEQLARADAVFTVPVFNGGRSINGMRAASHAHKAQEHRTERQKDMLTFFVSRLYYTIFNLERRLVSIQQSIEAMESNRKRVSSMIEAKKAAQVDLLRTNVRLAMLRQQMLIVRNQVAVHRSQLSAVMAVNISSRLLTTHIPADMAENVAPTDILYEQALRSRTDYRAAMESFEAQTRRVDVARGAFVPSLSLKGGYGIRTDVSGEYELAGVAGISLSVPLFEGGRNAAKINEERALLAALQYRMHTLRLQIATEIETALLDINAARERISIARMGIEAAKEGLRIENIKYEQGKGTISDVLDAQAELLEAETNHDEAYSALLVAYAQLQLASGGLSK